MQQHKSIFVAVTILVVSQWAGMIWLSNQVLSQQITDEISGLQETLSVLELNQKRIEELQFTKVVSVSPEANTVTMDQSILKNTLRDIVADELDRISPSLRADYSEPNTSAIFENETQYIEPEQAYIQSKAILEEAIQYGEWDAKHTAQMAPFVNSLSPEQRIELTEQYMGALDRGEIKPTDIPPPL